MAHYAQINSDNVVVNVLVMDNDMETNDGEQACIDWLQANVHADDWVKTSYNNNIRKQYAGVGFTYDSSNSHTLRGRWTVATTGKHPLQCLTMPVTIYVTLGTKMLIRPTILLAGF